MDFVWRWTSRSTPALRADPPSSGGLHFSRTASITLAAITSDSDGMIVPIYRFSPVLGLRVKLLTKRAKWQISEVGTACLVVGVVQMAEWPWGGISVLRGYGNVF